MKVNTSVLKSDYIIDGIRMDATPQAMLEMACERETCSTGETFEPIVDESVDPSPFAEDLDAGLAPEYLERILSMGRRNVPICYSASFSNGRLAQTLLDSIWMAGHFRLGDLAVSASWKWDSRAVGSMSALYSSVEAVCGYLEDLGVKLKDYSVDCLPDGPAPAGSSAGTMDLEFKVSLSDTPASEELGYGDDGEDFFDELPFRTEHPTLRHTRKCGDKAMGGSMNWIIYIPFDPGAPLLGGSALSEALGKPCGKAPAIDAADYFIDCYEVVRELVEDGIVLSGETVGEGGIMAALRRYVPEELGMEAEIGGIMKSYGENDAVRILFSEVPGVLIEIPDEDYDYVDAELLLQDVAYYPLGHLNDTFSGIRTTTSDSSDITQILHSLLNGSVSEGED